MIVGFDPVAGDVTIDFEDGRPPLSLPAERLLVKHYGEEGIFFAEAATPDEVEVGYLPAPDVPTVAIQVRPKGSLLWHLAAGR